MIATPAKDMKMSDKITGSAGCISGYNAVILAEIIGVLRLYSKLTANGELYSLKLHTNECEILLAYSCIIMWCYFF